MAMILYWNRCEGETWCPFLTVNLAHPHFQSIEGVYVIWHGGQAPWTVRVGQGAIAERLRAHRLDQTILSYSYLGLFVTWAGVDLWNRNGVERFLADRLKPKVGTRAPDTRPIEVNLPW
jgi:hypothetical protein